MARHVLARSLHDVGLGAWFGGSLMGAVGLNGAAASLRNPDERSGAATTGWTRWAPLNAAAIGAHLVGAVQLLITERDRVRHQEGVARSSAIKTALTVAAVGTTAYSGVLNRKMAAAGNVPAAGATEPNAQTPSDAAKAQKQLKAVQWAIPALTGALEVVTAWQGEQMRPEEQARGRFGALSLSSLTSLPTSKAGAAPLAIAGGGLGVFLASRRRSSRSGSSASSSDTSGSSIGAGSSSYGDSSALGAGGTTGTSSLPPVTDTSDLGTSDLGTSGLGTSDMSSSSTTSSTGGDTIDLSSDRSTGVGTAPLT